MNNIKHIIKREYFTRVRKRSFIIMTILGPILMAALMIVPAVISKFSDEQKRVAVIDENGTFKKSMESSQDVKYINEKISVEEAKIKMRANEYDAVLFIPNNNMPNRAYLFSSKQLGLGVKSYIHNSMKSNLERLFTEMYCDLNIDSIRALQANNRILIDDKTIDENGQEIENSTFTNTILGLVAGFIVYFFVFMFGSQVMRGVIEEKSNRIIEVIISSVKPIHLMFGKIIGIALVGLTQFFLWVALTFIIVTAFQLAQPDLLNSNKDKTKNSITTQNTNTFQGSKLQSNNLTTGDQEMTDEITESLKTLPLGRMILMFLFYFLGGYLLYGSLFAAIGAAVDSEADTQQFMLPVTIPLVFALVMSQFVINNPSGPVAYWLSIIPFTSPIIMMIRMPFDVPIHEIILSMTLLIFGFILTTWLAAKIYRTGILMYGKKISYRELWKWLRYKN